MTISARMLSTPGDVRPLARHWADKFCAAVNRDGTFRDPELEAEYLAWKKEKDARKAEE